MCLYVSVLLNFCSVYTGFTSISEPTALLTSYVEYVFQNPSTPGVHLYEELCKNWLSVMKKVLF
jgi:hypothetical protein